MFLQDEVKEEKTSLSDKIKGNTVLIDQKTKLIDENYMLQKRKAKDLATLEKVPISILLALNFCQSQKICLPFHPYFGFVGWVSHPSDYLIMIVVLKSDSPKGVFIHNSHRGVYAHIFILHYQVK